MLKIGKNLSERSPYSCKPKTKKELLEIIKYRISKEGTNCDLNDIDVSQITDMSRLFTGTFFNGDISNWDVSNVEDMSTMFYNCESFKGKGLEKWNVSKVENMSNMFHWCLKFDCDLSGWNVSKVEDMDNMFCLTSFTGKGLEKWNVSNVYNMRDMFNGCNEFDCDLSNWDVSNVENMEGMFRGCKKFKGKGLDKWNPVNLKVIRVMFDNCDMKDKPKWFYDKCYSYKNKKHKRMYF